jgi:hypothetical protein
MTLGPVLRPTTSKLSRTTSRKSPLLVVATYLPFAAVLILQAPYWQQILSPYDVSVISKVYAPLAMYVRVSAAVGAKAA